jgi:hypothetical protein
MLRPQVDGADFARTCAVILALTFLLTVPAVSFAQEAPESDAAATAPAESTAPAGSGDMQPAAPAAAAEAESAAPAPASPGQKAYDHKLRELEERVVSLKEKIFRTKTRLLLLKERILNDVIAEAKLVLQHVDDMGLSFKPVQVYYRLDGEDVKLLDNATGALEGSEPVEIFAGNVAPGNHNLQVEMVYRGDSAVFSYMNDYVFKLRANYTFYATKGKITTVTARGYLKGDITYDLTERPSITFKVEQRSYTKETLAEEDSEDDAASQESE